MYLQFAYYVATMGDDGVDRDEKFIGNLLIRHALHKTDYYLFFSLRHSLSTIGTLYHVCEACRHIVGFHFLLQQSDGWHKQHFLDIAMVCQPLLIIIYIIESGGELMVSKSVMWKILDDDIFQLKEFACSVAMVLREYFHVIVRHLLSSKQSLNIREESLL